MYLFRASLGSLALAFASAKKISEAFVSEKPLIARVSSSNDQGLVCWVAVRLFIEPSIMRAAANVAPVRAEVWNTWIPASTQASHVNAWPVEGGAFSRRSDADSRVFVEKLTRRNDDILEATMDLRDVQVHILGCQLEDPGQVCVRSDEGEVECRKSRAISFPRVGVCATNALFLEAVTHKMQRLRAPFETSVRAATSWSWREGVRIYRHHNTVSDPRVVLFETDVGRYEYCRGGVVMKSGDNRSPAMTSRASPALSWVEDANSLGSLYCLCPEGDCTLGAELESVEFQEGLARLWWQNQTFTDWAPPFPFTRSDQPVLPWTRFVAPGGLRSLLANESTVLPRASASPEDPFELHSVEKSGECGRNWVTAESLGPLGLISQLGQRAPLRCEALLDRIQRPLVVIDENFLEVHWLSASLYSVPDNITDLNDNNVVWEMNESLALADSFHSVIRISDSAFSNVLNRYLEFSPHLYIRHGAESWLVSAPTDYDAGDFLAIGENWMGVRESAALPSAALHISREISGFSASAFVADNALLWGVEEETPDVLEGMHAQQIVSHDPAGELMSYWSDTCSLDANASLDLASAPAMNNSRWSACARACQVNPWCRAVGEVADTKADAETVCRMAWGGYRRALGSDLVRCWVKAQSVLDDPTGRGCFPNATDTITGRSICCPEGCQNDKNGSDCCALPSAWPSCLDRSPPCEPHDAGLGPPWEGDAGLGDNEVLFMLDDAPRFQRGSMAGATFAAITSAPQGRAHDGLLVAFSPPVLAPPRAARDLSFDGASSCAPNILAPREEPWSPWHLVTGQAGSPLEEIDGFIDDDLRASMVQRGEVSKEVMMAVWSKSSGHTVYRSVTGPSGILSEFFSRARDTGLLRPNTSSSDELDPYIRNADAYSQSGGGGGGGGGDDGGGGGGGGGRRGFRTPEWCLVVSRWLRRLRKSDAMILGYSSPPPKGGGGSGGGMALVQLVGGELTVKSTVNADAWSLGLDGKPAFSRPKIWAPWEEPPGGLVPLRLDAALPLESFSNSFLLFFSNDGPTSGVSLCTVINDGDFKCIARSLPSHSGLSPVVRLRQPGAAVEVLLRGVVVAGEDAAGPLVVVPFGNPAPGRQRHAELRDPWLFRNPSAGLSSNSPALILGAQEKTYTLIHLIAQTQVNALPLIGTTQGPLRGSVLRWTAAIDFENSRVDPLREAADELPIRGSEEWGPQLIAKPPGGSPFAEAIGNIARRVGNDGWLLQVSDGSSLAILTGENATKLLAAAPRRSSQHDSKIGDVAARDLCRCTTSGAFGTHCNATETQCSENGASEVCSGNGVCSVDYGGSGKCACFSGWTGENCDTCSHGYFGSKCSLCTKTCQHSETTLIIATCDVTSGSCTCVNGMTGCFSCPPGEEARQDSCVSCPVGFAKAISDVGTCEPCSAGSFSATSGASSCQLCARGTFSSQPGASSCVACSPGTSAGSQGQTACESCSAGSFAAEAGSSVCTSCAVGFFSATDNQTACEKCPRGYFTSESGLSKCTACGPGAITDGSSMCQECSQGRFAKNKTECSECSPGKISTGGVDACAHCAPGKFASSYGLSLCTDCPRGRSAKSGGSTACAACAVGTFAKEEGANECAACGCKSAGTASCNPEDGSCACFAAFTGQFCDKCASPDNMKPTVCECKADRWGPNCAETCSCNSKGGACNNGWAGDGSCTCHQNFQGPTCDACKDGWAGSDCNVACPEDCRNACTAKGKCQSGAATPPENSFAKFFDDMWHGAMTATEIAVVGGVVATGVALGTASLYGISATTVTDSVLVYQCDKVCGSVYQRLRYWRAGGRGYQFIPSEEPGYQMMHLARNSLGRVSGGLMLTAGPAVQCLASAIENCTTPE